MDHSLERGTGTPERRRLARYSTAFPLAAAAIATALLLGRAAWPQQPAQALLLGLFTLAAILSAALDARTSPVANGAAIPFTFVIAVATLLLFEPAAMTVTATTAVLTRALLDRSRSQPGQRALVDVAAILAATQTAAFAFILLGGTPGAPRTWPWDGVPIAAAALVFCLVWTGTIDLVVPLLDGRAAPRSWPRSVLRLGPFYVIATGAAVALVALIEQGAWQILPIAAAPIYFAGRAFVAYVGRVESSRRHRDHLESFDRGTAVLDHHGRVTVWNPALARLVNCPRERALGRALVDAIPALARTELPRAIDEALQRGRFRTVPAVTINTADGERILHVEIQPDVEGAAVRWQDVTERTQTDRTLHQAADRLALAAAGAMDALWEWDLRSQQLYVSPRWRAMLGLAPGADVVPPDEWFDRIHTDDRGGFNKALEAHLAGQVDHIHCEMRMRHEDGKYRRVLCRAVAVIGSAVWQTRIAGSLTDISDGAIAQEWMRSAEFRDPLTGLCNRAVFVKGLGQRLHDLKHRRGGRFAVLYLDLDRFKVVNDSLGHLVGDELLTSVSRRLESCLRSGDALARLGGDEFAILLNGLGDIAQANAIAFRIQDTLSAPFSIAGREVVTSASIGIAFSRTEYTNPEELMRDADTAMYHAKAHGKARHELFDADMHARALDRLGFEGDLRQAIKAHDFALHYQPIVSLTSGMCAGFEALVRWTRHGQSVSPIEFIPVAEELGLIEPLGTWILEEACRTFAGWQRRFPASELDCITVNVSTRQLMQQGFVYIVEQAVGGAGMQPSDLRLEITETALMDAPRETAQVLRDLREFGVKIYLDDFGTGYSSLSHLHKLPVDALKIDRSFVRSLTLDDRPAIVESILALARTLNTGVVAEGVETEVQAHELTRLGCRHAQGYYFSPPLTVGAVEEILAARRPLGNPRPAARLQPAASIAPHDPLGRRPIAATPQRSQHIA